MSEREMEKQHCDEEVSKTESSREGFREKSGSVFNKVVESASSSKTTCQIRVFTLSSARA